MIPIFAESRLSWMPAITGTQWCVLIATCSVAWVILRAGWGKSLARRHLGLSLLRTVVLIFAISILLGPSIVDEQPGQTSRSTLYYLLDGSQSMQLGGQSTRWQDCLSFVGQAEEIAGRNVATQCKSYRFGHRLMPLHNESQTSTANTPQSPANTLRTEPILTQTKSAPTNAAPPESTNLEAKIAPPDATDSRLADALRQLSTQIDPGGSAGVVLLSDGRVRATESVERMAEHFGKNGIPIHVVPVGQMQGTGDIAIVSLVSEPRVRKYTENEMTLFIRSFGFNGQRTVARIFRQNRLAVGDQTQLAEVPITLTGGAQSVVLSFRVEDRSEELTVVVDSIPGELTDRNNRVQTHIEIDRTKLRVLYVEGESGIQSSLINSIASIVGVNVPAPANITMRASNIRDALQEDEDIECTVVLRMGVGQLRTFSQSGSRVGEGFPQTRAELFSYDCLVFSHIGPGDLELEPQQLEQLSLWIEGRGGGMIVTGREALETASWDSNPLAALLPIRLDELKQTAARDTVVRISELKHPIWRLRFEESSNAQLLGTLPPLQLGVSNVVTKPMSQTLATTAEEPSQPVLVAQRAGRGRVLVSTVDLAGNAFTTLAESWGPQPERAAGKLWRNLVYWATEGSSVGRRRLVATSDKRFYRPGEKLQVTAVAFDESARRSQKYGVWAMFEPMSLDNSSLYSPVLWPENVKRESGETGPRIAWGEELPLQPNAIGEHYTLDLMLSESSGLGDNGLRIEMTAYEGAAGSTSFDHGTQVDSTSLAVQILSDPFEQQNPLPNRELMVRLAQLSGGQVLQSPDELARIIKNRKETVGAPKREVSPAWSQWWIWLMMLGLLTSEWIWRRTTGLA